MKNKITSTPLMVIVIMLALIIFTSTAYAKPPRMKRDRQKASIYWQYRKQTVSGKHDYHQPGFGYRSTCASYKNLPIKNINFKRYHFHRQNKDRR